VVFAAITFCVASQRVFIVVIVNFASDSVRKLLDTPSYCIEIVTQSLAGRLRIFRFVVSVIAQSDVTQRAEVLSVLKVQFTVEMG
jgi:hypothetical protein